MKKFIATGLLILSIFVFFNCVKKSNVKPELSLISRIDYIEKLKSQIDQWSIELDNLVVNVQKLNGKIRLKADEQIALIRIQHDGMKKILGEIKNSEDNAWIDLKRGAESGKIKINMAFLKAEATIN